MAVKNDKDLSKSEFVLTTKDNPYDPFTQWDEWYAFDEAKGYCSCGYLSRIANTSPDMPDEWNETEIKRAIEEIIAIDPFNIYTKAYRKGSEKEPTI